MIYKKIALTVVIPMDRVEFIKKHLGIYINSYQDTQVKCYFVLKKYRL